MFGFEAEIQLPQQHPTALLGDADPVAALAPAGMALNGGGHLLEHLQIESEGALQAWTLHLQHHLTATAQAGPVHLGQAGGTEGFSFKVDYLSAAPAQFLLEQVLNHGEGKGRHLVLQGGQLLHQLGGQHVRAGREQLAELDEGRTQGQKFVGEPAGPPHLATPLTLFADTAQVGPTLSVPPEPQHQGQGQPPDAQGPQQDHEVLSRRLAMAATLARRSSI